MTSPVPRVRPLSSFEQLRLGRDILQAEAQALTDVAGRLGSDFLAAVELLLACHGHVVVTGMGKAGLVGQKIAATLASTGTRSMFLHPAEAVHGDLGRIGRDDVILVLSQSGETEETLRILPAVAELPLIAITARPESTLARRARVTLDLGPLREACPLGLAPSTSTTAMMALGDALALVTSRMRGFAPDDFARFHPGGSLGRRLAKVEDVMRPIDQCRVACDGKSVRAVFVDLQRPGRRTGAIMLVAETGRLSGLFTDSDLARLFERRSDAALDGPIRDVMTATPTTVHAGTSLSEAVQLLAQRRISELPVVDDAGHPLGLLDITDLLSLLPPDSTVTAEADAHGADVADESGDENDDDDAPATLPFAIRSSQR